MAQIITMPSRVSLASNLSWPKSIKYRSKETINRGSCKSNRITITWYHNLPTNILIKIFSHFEEKELRRCIMQVCQRWKNVAASPQLWNKLVFRGKHIPTNFICQQIRIFPKLQKVCLVSVAEPTVVIRQICRSLPELKHLIVRDTNSVHELTLRNVIKSCEHLETFDLKQTVFKGNLFYEELSALRHLKCINFSGNPHMSVQNLMTVLLNCHNIEEIYLSKFSSCIYKNQLSDTDTSFMITNIASTLRSLVLDAITLTDISFQAILKCNKLECLGLYGASNLSSHLFTNLWKYLPNLKQLKIRHAHQITDDDVIELFTKGKEVMQQVEIIDFTGCWKIKSKCIGAIVDCCNNLRSLTLKSCKSITDLSMLHDKCPNLELLNIAFCNVQIDCLPPLLKYLKVLVIHENHAFNKIIADMKSDGSHIGLHACISEYNDNTKRLQLN